MDVVEDDWIAGSMMTGTIGRIAPQVVECGTRLFDAVGIRTAQIHGGCSPSARSSAVVSFMTDPDVKVILLTTGSAAAGKSQPGCSHRAACVGLRWGVARERGHGFRGSSVDPAVVWVVMPIARSPSASATRSHNRAYGRPDSMINTR